MSAVPARIGFFGKVPSRGDFVRADLSQTLADAVHAWMDAALPNLDAEVGTDWRDAWGHARPWRFAAVAGAMARDAVSGLWFPSSDRVGRLYPLLVAVEAVILDEAALSAAEMAGAAAVRDGVEPDDLARSLTAIPTTPRDGGQAAPAPILWWRDVGEVLASEALPLGPALVRLLAP